MIRVGFEQIGGGWWMGGKNYLWNLIFAVSRLPDRQLRPVLISAEPDAELEKIPGVERVPAPAVEQRLLRLGGLALRFAVGHDLMREHAMARARIDVLSHADPLGRRARTPVVSWIADMQHRRRPEFFSARERMMRDFVMQQMVRHSKRIVVSSQAALGDLERFYGPRALRKGRVLRFVSQPRIAAEAIAPLPPQYALAGRYFHLPNQFWRHKNHRIVIEALRLVRDEEPELQVIATGPAEDYRNPTHYAELMAHARALGVAERFRHLGVVPFDHLMSLMKHAVAVINPSYFEGWSTTVEEAKSLGKAILLSDIDVHREQAPERGFYFAPDDAPALARLLVDVWRGHDASVDEAARRRAAANLEARTTAFATAYQDIVKEAIGGD